MKEGSQCQLGDCSIGQEVRLGHILPTCVFSLGWASCMLAPLSCHQYYTFLWASLSGTSGDKALLMPHLWSAPPNPGCSGRLFEGWGNSSVLCNHAPPSCQALLSFL